MRCIKAPGEAGIKKREDVEIHRSWQETVEALRIDTAEAKE